MLKYLALLFFAVHATATVELRDGKTYIKTDTALYPLEQFELTPRAEARLFSKSIPQELAHLSARPSPRRYDLKYRMSDVKGQGARSNCSAFQAVGLVEQYLNRAKLSEQCLVYHSTAQDLGDPYLRLKHILSNGIHYQSDCPYVDPADYEGWYSADPATKKSLIEKAITTIPDLAKKPVATLPANIVHRNVDDMSATESVNYIRNKIAIGLPVGISVFVAGNGWSWGVIDSIPTDDEIRKTCPPKAEKSSSPKRHCNGHGVIVTGFDDSRRVFYFKNSWDKTWGVNQSYYPELLDSKRTGYGVMSYEYFAKFAIGKLITLE